MYLQKYIVYRKRKIFFGKSGKLNDPSLLAAMTKNNKEKFLLPVSDVHKEEFKILSENHIDFTVAVMYRTVSNDFGKDEKFDYDMLLFFSPSGISSLLKNFPDFDQKKNGIIIGTFGATTAKAVTDAGLELGFSAPTPETPSMSGALDKYLSDKSK